MPNNGYYTAQDLHTPWDKEHDERSDLPYRCSKCVWAHLIGGGRVVCMFDRCIVIKVGDMYYGRTGVTKYMEELYDGGYED